MCHVLIIEDEPLIALNIQMMLEDAGATSFDIAATEGDAVDAAIARRPDVITSDVALLLGTGPRAVQTIHDRLGPLPVIFITATPKDCEPCPAPAIVISKPFPAKQLVDAFRKVM